MSFQYGTDYQGVDSKGDEIWRPDTGYELIDSGRDRSAWLEGEPQRQDIRIQRIWHGGCLFYCLPSSVLTVLHRCQEKDSLTVQCYPMWSQQAAELFEPMRHLKRVLFSNQMVRCEVAINSLKQHMIPRPLRTAEISSSCVHPVLLFLSETL